ncbi:MAG TPA: hypothetical protein VFH61_12480, partial [Thermoleophilia bacterium]|nr:hypothetical protein [Thermoleophilia bacterium]
MNPFESQLGAKATGLDPFRQKSIELVEDRMLMCDGRSEPSYYDPAADAWYGVGQAAASAPSTADQNSGAGTFDDDTVLYYRFTHYNSAYGTETAPVAYEHTCASSGGPHDVRHTFAAPSSAQYDFVRFYRLAPGGTYHLAATVASGAGTWDDDVLEADLVLEDVMIRRRRTTAIPTFAGWIYARGMMWAWTGKDARVFLSQIRRADLAISNANMLVDFPTDLEAYFEPNDGLGRVTAVVKAWEQVYVFKEDGIYRVAGGYDPLDMDIKEITRGRGCIAQHSIQVVSSVIFFLDERGIFMLPPEGQPILAAALPGTNGSPLEPTWDGVNRRGLGLVWSRHDKRNGAYECYVPLGFSPVCNYRIRIDYRSSPERFMSVDENVYLAAGRDILDGAGLRHPLVVDDLGQVIELEQGDADLATDDDVISRGVSSPAAIGSTGVSVAGAMGVSSDLR